MYLFLKNGKCNRYQKSNFETVAKGKIKKQVHKIHKNQKPAVADHTSIMPLVILLRFNYFTG